MALTQVQPGMLGTPQPYNFKNRIINGGMVFDQRNAGASVNISNNTATYTIDRWLVYSNNDGLCSMQQVSDAPTGFIKSLKFTTTTADSSLGSTQRAMIQQRIEGLNATDLAWGTADAKTITLSFWVKSSLTGTFGGALQNEAVDRAYPFSYTISSANTWEQKSITIAGDTTGTWATNNTSWCRVCFGLGVGSTYSGTANAWVSADINSITGAVSVIGTLNATWQLTGVQLEVGVSATGFDYRPYGTELALCQRYFEKSYGQGVAVGTATAAGTLELYGSTDSAGNIVLGTYFRVEKRDSSVVIAYYNDSTGAATWSYFRNGATGTGAPTAYRVTTSRFQAYINTGAAWVVAYASGQWTASSEL